MKHISSRIVAYTCIYFVVIFGIFVLQFTKGKTFSLRLGAISVSGRHETTDSGAQVPLLPVHIVSNGLDVYINDQHPIMAVTTDKNTIPLKIESYTHNDTTFSIHCADSSVISFLSEKRGDVDTFRIEAVLAETTETVIVPWKITQNARIERSNGQVLVQAGNKQYIFTDNFGMSGSIQEHNDRLNEQPRIILTKRQPLAYYKTNLPSQNFELASVSGMTQASPEFYTQTLKTFREGVLQTTKTALTAKTADEHILAAYLAEMGRQGMLKKALRMFPAKSIPKDIRTYFLNPFYDNLQKTASGLAQAHYRKYDYYTDLIAAKDAEIFEKKGIIQLLTDKKRFDWIERLGSFAKTVPVSRLTVRQAAGILALNMDFSRYYPNKNNYFEPLCPACEKKIEEAFFLLDEGLYISNDDQTVDSTETLDIAHILMQYGTEQAAFWQAAGRMLITSLFVYSGESAALPADFTITGEKTGKRGLMINDNEILDAGVLYPLVFPDISWYPHVKSLALQAEAGIWAWTCAQDIEVLENTAKKLVLRVRFPQGSTDYLTLKGIRPFYQIKLYDIPFRSDPRFEIYNSSGYAYDKSKRVLYLKMYHKKEYETIELSFGTKKKVKKPAAVTPQKPTPETPLTETAPTGSDTLESAQAESGTSPIEQPPLDAGSAKPSTSETEENLIAE